jgi:hypothetical protein
MKREDVIQVDALKTELAGAFRQFEQRLTGVFGELVYAVDTVIDRSNDLDAKHAELAASHARLAGQLDAVSERLLALERLRGEH